MRRLLCGAILAAALVGWTHHVHAAVPALHGIGIAETVDGPAVLAAALPPDSPGATLPLVVQLTVRGGGSTAELDRLDARVAVYRSRNIPVVLVFGAFPQADADVQQWLDTMRRIAVRERGKIAAYQFGAIADAPAALPNVDAYAYVLKQASIAVRAVDPDALVAQGAIRADDVDWLTRVYAAGTAPYVDAVVIAAAGADTDTLRSSVQAIAAIATREDPTASVWLGPVTLTNQPGTAADQLIASSLRSVGTRVDLTLFRGGEPGLRAGLTAASRLRDLLTGDLVALDTPVKWLRRGADVTSTVPSRLLFSMKSTDTYLLFGGVSSAGPADVEIDAVMQHPTIRNPLTGATQTLPPPAAAAGTPARLTVPLAAQPLILDFNYGTQTATSSAEAREATLPPVGEIIARHQQVQAAQDAALNSYVAHLRIEQHFHPTPADPAYNLVFENQLFFDRTGLEWVQLSLSINGATWRGGDPPSLPLLQPEKVLSLPLELRLNQDYGYRLDGVEKVGGREAFIVRFDPTDAARALYRGTVWIDRASFVRLKVTAVETRASGVVSSNEEEQRFSNVGEIGGRPIWLATEFLSRQTFLVAGRTLLNEREMHLTEIRVNPADFETARAAARASDRVMYRDTDRGVRYLVKRGGARVVSETTTTSARALAVGADIDPSLDYPLPIAGIDILDFDFLHRNLQLALLFGGVIAVGNVQRAGLWGGRFDASVDFFGLAVKSNDSVFDPSGERQGERVRSLPVSTGVNFGYRATSTQKFTARFETRYDAYSRDPLTSSTFVLPASTATFGEGASYEYRSRGYSFLGNATAYQRNRWTPWGDVTTFDPSTRTYARYDLGLSKDFVFATFHTVHLNGQYFGGTRLDRFSRYQFGLFDATRLHGVPSAVRFDALAMFRGSYSFNLFNVYRFDLFFDHAMGRNASIDDRWRPVTGLGVSVNLRGPRSTILRADVGHSFLPARYRGAGSTVVQIMVLKPL